MLATVGKRTVIGILVILHLMLASNVVGAQERQQETTNGTEISTLIAGTSFAAPGAGP